VVRIHVPPLRERRDDIPLLLDHFLDSCSQQYQVARCEITPQAMDLLVEHRWPGKIRELRNVVEQLVVKAGGAPVKPADLPADLCRRFNSPPVVPIEVTDAAQPLPVTLVEQMLQHGEPFWSTVYPLFMSRDLSRAQLRAIIKTGLELSGGNYRVLTQLFNMAPGD